MHTNRQVPLERSHSMPRRPAPPRPSHPITAPESQTLHPMGGGGGLPLPCPSPLPTPSTQEPQFRSLFGSVVVLRVVWDQFCGMMPWRSSDASLAATSTAPRSSSTSRLRLSSHRRGTQTTWQGREISSGCRAATHRHRGHAASHRSSALGLLKGHQKLPEAQWPWQCG